MTLLLLLQSNEHVNIEVKAAGKGSPNSIWKSYSSFANTFGGAIILGIEENKDAKEFIPRGIHNPQQMLSDIWNMLNNHQKISNNILLEHHVYSARHGDMDFIVIEVPRADRRDKPIYIGQDMFKGTFKRNHEGVDRLTADVKTPFKLDSNLQRVDDTPIHRSLRECLANALIHKLWKALHNIAITASKAPTSRSKYSTTGLLRKAPATCPASSA